MIGLWAIRTTPGHILVPNGQRLVDFTLPVRQAVQLPVAPAKSTVGPRNPVMSVAHQPNRSPLFGRRPGHRVSVPRNWSAEYPSLERRTPTSTEGERRAPGPHLTTECADCRIALSRFRPCNPSRRPHACDRVPIAPHRRRHHFRRPVHPADRHPGSGSSRTSLLPQQCGNYKLSTVGRLRHLSRPKQQGSVGSPTTNLVMSTGQIGGSGRDPPLFRPCDRGGN
jgi:hypothetical protein